MSGKPRTADSTKAGASDRQHKPDKALKGRRTVPSMTQSKVSVASSKASGGSEQSKASSISSKSGRSLQSKASSRSTFIEPQAKSSISTKAKSSDRKTSPTKLSDSPTQQRASKVRGTKGRSDTEPAGVDAETKKQADSKAKRPSGLKVANPDDEVALDGEVAVQSKASHSRSASGKPKAADEEAANIKSKATAIQDSGPNKAGGKDSGKGGASRLRFSAFRRLLRHNSLAVMNVMNVARFASRRAPKPPRKKPNEAVQSSGANQPAPASDTRGAVRKPDSSEETGHSELDSQQQRCLALCGALSLAVLILVFVSVVTYFLTGDTNVVTVACETPECIAAKAYIQGLLGDRRDRCTDFYSYVCARLIQNQSSPSEVAFAKLHDGLLRELGASGDKLGGHVAATIYSGCHAFLDWGESLANEMREASQFIMTAQLRSAANFSQITQLLVRISFQRGVHSVLVIGLVRFADDLSTSLHLSPGKSLLRKFHSASHDHLERSLTTAFAWSPQVNTVQALKDLINIDKRVEKALAASDQEAVEVNGPLRSCVGGLTRGVNASTWVAALKDAVPVTFAISAESGCFTEAFTGVRRAFRQLTAVGVRRAASYLAANLEAEIALLEDARQNLKADYEAKRRFCLELTRQSVSLNWHSLASRILYSFGNEASVMDMFKTLRAVFNKKSVAFTWLETEERAAALNRLDATALTLIGLKKTQHANASYEKFTLVITEGKDFVSGYMIALKENQWLQTVTPPTRWGSLDASMTLTASIEYKPRLRSIVVPPLLMAEPYFYGKAVPLHFNYGTVGSLLASRITEVLDAEHMEAHYSSDTGPEENPPSNESRWRGLSASRRKSVECLRELSARLGPADGASEPQHRHLDILLAWAQGLRVAYEALVTWFTSVAGDSERLQHYWPAAQVMFFTRFCLLSCSADRRPTADVPGRDRCLVPLHNMRQFAETFECEDSKGFIGASCPL